MKKVPGRDPSRRSREVVRRVPSRRPGLREQVPPRTALTGSDPNHSAPPALLGEPWRWRSTESPHCRRIAGRDRCEADRECPLTSLIPHRREPIVGELFIQSLNNGATGGVQILGRSRRRRGGSYERAIQLFAVGQPVQTRLIIGASGGQRLASQEIAIVVKRRDHWSHESNGLALK